MPRIERTNKKYNRAKVKEILRADLEPSEASFDNVEDLLAWLHDLEPQSARRDCPWKCGLHNPDCLCAKQRS